MNLPDILKVIKFGVVGCSGIVIDFLLTFLCKEKLRMNKYVANAIGFTCAATSNFLLNNFWTFQSNKNLLAERFFVFAAISVAGLGINSSVIFLLTKKFNINFYLSKVAAVGVVFIWNFLMNNYITFGKIS